MKNNEKEIENFIKKLPRKYKDEFILLKINSLKKAQKIIPAYKANLFLLSREPHNNYYLELKRDLEKSLKSLEYNTREEKQQIEKILELGKTFDLKEEIIEDDSIQYADFTNLIMRIRDASTHALTEVDYSSVGEEQFTIEKNKLSKDERVKLKDIKFNFQDYDSKEKKTTFLLMNIPINKCLALIDIPSDKILMKVREIRKDREER